MARTQLFISYAHEDNRLRLRVVSHLGVLARARLIDIWDDRKLEAGDDWLAQIDDAMSHARIALLLISAPFLTSHFIQKKEIPRLFKRHEADGMTIYPLLIRSCSWEQVRWLRRMQIRPDNARPVSDFKGNKIDAVLTEVAREIAKMAKRASKKSRKRASKKSQTPTSKKVRPRMRKTRTRVSKKVRMGGSPRSRKRASKRETPK